MPVRGKMKEGTGEIIFLASADQLIDTRAALQHLDFKLNSSLTDVLVMLRYPNTLISLPPR